LSDVQGKGIAAPLPGTVDSHATCLLSAPTALAERIATMNCPSCGADVAANALFCHKCGERLEAGEPANENAAAPDPAEPAGSDRGEGSPAMAGGIREVIRQRRSAGDDAEEELWTGSYSSKDMIGVWVVDALITIGLIVAGFFFQEPILWWVILGVVVLLWGYSILVLLYRRMSVRYRLTTQRFFHETGILRHITNRIEVIDMDDISFEQSIMQRMVNVGRVRITSSDRSHPELVINGIEDVRRVATLMDDARRAERMRRGLHIEAV
jgi:membrane protein YdbS with pleckstrin-like domain